MKIERCTCQKVQLKGGEKSGLSVSEHTNCIVDISEVL